MRIVILCGGFASGKSTLGKILSLKQLPVIEIDDLCSRFFSGDESTELKTHLVKAGLNLNQQHLNNSIVFRKQLFAAEKAPKLLAKFLLPVLQETIEKKINSFREDGKQSCVLIFPAWPRKLVNFFLILGISFSFLVYL